MNAITTVITTYNGASRGYLEQAIQSVLDQTYKNSRLLIVDDGSTDQTKELCQKYLSNNKVSYVYRENGGPAAARNMGIKLAETELITFLDDDDFYEPSMLEEMLSTFTGYNDANIGMIYCRTQHIKKGVVKNAPFPSEVTNSYEKLFYGNFITTSALLIHKKVFNTVGYFKENLKYSEDYDMWLRIAKQYGVYPLNKTLVNYRVHDNQLSSHPQIMYNFHRKVLKEAIEKAPAKIKKEKENILLNLHINYANINLGYHEYTGFREQYRLASQYQRLGAKWKLKYLLSYFPYIMRYISKVK
ncbi:MAG: glycosyltransferase [Chlamydiota bacterium]|nr:glycosyltransferase [Chlamydiota bacterium]